MMLTKLSMFQGADQTALTYCMCAILVQLLKRMDGAKRNALIDKAPSHSKVPTPEIELSCAQLACFVASGVRSQDSDRSVNPTAEVRSF